MEGKLNSRQILVVASMLFGLLFGAGNLIFPISMGQLSGAHMWQAAAGFVITGVGIPILGVAALGISQENSMLELSGRVGRRYGLFFTCALHLTIGPFFCDPAVCYCFFYHRACASFAGGQSEVGFGSFLFGLFCGGFGFFRFGRARF